MICSKLEKRKDIRDIRQKSQHCMCKNGLTIETGARMNVKNNKTAVVAFILFTELFKMFPFPHRTVGEVGSPFNT